jgi:hypothetical protein
MLIFLSNTVSASKQKNKSQKKEQQRSSTAFKFEHQSVPGSAYVFTSKEAGILNNYKIKKQAKKKKNKKLPKGLEKKISRGGSLPPGWQKKLKRGDVIDKETYRYAKPLPDQIIAQLPVAPVGTITVEIEGEIVRLAEATMTIIDILRHR